MPEKICKCKNPECGRYFRESRGDADTGCCCRKCSVKIDYNLMKVDQALQILLMQEYEKQDEGE